MVNKFSQQRLKAIVVGIRIRKMQSWVAIMVSYVFLFG